MSYHIISYHIIMSSEPLNHLVFPKLTSKTPSLGCPGRCRHLGGCRDSPRVLCCQRCGSCGRARRHAGGGRHGGHGGRGCYGRSEARGEGGHGSWGSGGRSSCRTEGWGHRRTTQSRSGRWHGSRICLEVAWQIFWAGRSCFFLIQKEGWQKKVLCIGSSTKMCFQTYILVVFYKIPLEEMLDVSRQLVALDSHKKQSRIQKVTNDNY